MSERKNLSRRQFVKKTALLGAGLVGSSGLLAACGDSPTSTAAPGSSATTTAASSASTATTAAPVSQKVELTYWDWWVTQAPWVDNEIKLFQEANPGITIKKTTNETNTYADLFALAVKGNNAPDVFLIPQKPSYAEIVANGWMVPLNQFADFQDFTKRFPNPTQNFAEGTNTIGGKTYSAPFGDASDGMWLYLWINTKVFKDAGLVDSAGNVKLPETADDMLQAARTIKEKSGGKTFGYGFSLKSDYLPSWQFYLAQLSGADPIYNGGLDLRTGKYTYGTNPAYKSSIDLLLKMRDEGLIIPDSASADDESMRVLFAQHKFGMLVSGNWVMTGWQKTNPEFKDFTLTHIPLFGTSEPKSYFYLKPGGSQFAVNPKAKNLDAAWKWFKWLYSKEAGERWVKSGNGRSIFPDANKPEYATNDAMRQAWSQSPKYSRVGPVPALRNPDVGKVKIKGIKPDENAIIVGLYTGRLTDISAALKDLDAAKQKALEEALTDAKAAGAKVSIEDYIFADWDPTKDYVTKPR
jgi:ABC-type glycerol-3-phosphate transport system substrate-binding protein